MTTDTPTRRRCFGYTLGGAIIDAEADVISRITRMVLSGKWSLSDAVRYLNEEGWPTTAGGRWSATSLNRLLINPRLAGLAPKSRTCAQNAPAIITKAQHSELTRQAKERQTGKYHRSGSGRALRLLSGLLVCGVCEQRLTGHLNPLGPSYRCPDGHVVIQAAGIEQHVSALAVDALSAGLDPILPTPQELPDFSQDRRRIHTDRLCGRITARDAQRAYARLTYREKAAAAEAERVPQIDLPTPASATIWWEHAADDTRRAVICGLIQAVWIAAQRSSPGHPRTGLDTSRVQITMRPDLALVS